MLNSFFFFFLLINFWKVWKTEISKSAVPKYVDIGEIKIFDEVNRKY